MEGGFKKTILLSGIGFLVAAFIGFQIQDKLAVSQMVAMAYRRRALSRN
jgi:hypothetical protein